MSIRPAEFLIFSLLLLTPSLQEDAIAPWVPAKDALVKIPATPAGPAVTYVHFQPEEASMGRRLPAVFLIKTPKEEDVVAYLTGIDGELGEDLLAKVIDGDKILWEYLTSDQRDHQAAGDFLAEGVLRHSRLPEPFSKLRLSVFHLPSPSLSLAELAKFLASSHTTATSIVLVAERSDIFPSDDERPSIEDVSEEDSD